jgi:hypothetical protein
LTENRKLRNIPRSPAFVIPRSSFVVVAQLVATPVNVLRILPQALNFHLPEPPANQINDKEMT